MKKTFLLFAFLLSILAIFFLHKNVNFSFELIEKNNLSQEGKVKTIIEPKDNILLELEEKNDFNKINKISEKTLFINEKENCSSDLRFEKCTFQEWEYTIEIIKNLDESYWKWWKALVNWKEIYSSLNFCFSDDFYFDWEEIIVFKVFYDISKRDKIWKYIEIWYDLDREVFINKYKYNLWKYSPESWYNPVYFSDRKDSISEKTKYFNLILWISFDNLKEISSTKKWVDYIKYELDYLSIDLSEDFVFNKKELKYYVNISDTIKLIAIAKDYKDYKVFYDYYLEFSYANFDEKRYIKFPEVKVPIRSISYFPQEEKIIFESLWVFEYEEFRYTWQDIIFNHLIQTPHWENVDY